mgnify:CR=1 FL=1
MCIVLCYVEFRCFIWVPADIVFFFLLEVKINNESNREIVLSRIELRILRSKEGHEMDNSGSLELSDGIRSPRRGSIGNSLKSSLHPHPKHKVVRKFVTKIGSDKEFPLEGFPVSGGSNYEGTFDFLLHLEPFLPPTSPTVSHLFVLHFAILAKHIGPNNMVQASLPLVILKS